MLNLLRSNFRKWRWHKVVNRPAVGVAFEAGDRVIVSSQGVEILRDGPDAARLASLCEPSQAQISPEPAPPEESPSEPSPYIDGPDFY